MRRGTKIDPPNRFEVHHREIDLEQVEPDQDELRALQSRKTEYFYDLSTSIVTENKSPDIPFRYSLNPYRGCEHGCSYCYARPTHEYLGFSAGADFESKIVIKERAPSLLRKFLSKPNWKPEPFMLSGVTDPYQPLEREKRITRGMLELLAECRHPVNIITKNALIERDVDLLRHMAADGLVHVAISITTLDAALARDLEPRTSTPIARLRAIKTLADAGVPTRIMTAPVIPGLNDHEIPRLLTEGSKAGATSAGYVMLRLPGTVAPVFEDWLSNARPDLKSKIIDRIRDVRGGEISDSQFGRRMRGTGTRADSIAEIFQMFVKKCGMTIEADPLRCDHFQPPVGRDGQLNLF